MRVPGASRHISLNSVTVSARSISSPRAFSIGTMPAIVTCMVARPPTARWNASTGTPNIRARIRNSRVGCRRNSAAPPRTASNGNWVRCGCVRGNAGDKGGPLTPDSAARGGVHACVCGAPRRICRSALIRGNKADVFRQATRVPESTSPNQRTREMPANLGRRRRVRSFTHPR